MLRQRKVLRFSGNNLTEEIEERKEEAKENTNGKFLQTVSFASEMGFSIALPIAGGAFLGNFLDDKFASSPRLTLSFIFLGLFIGVANIYSIIKKIKS